MNKNNLIGQVFGYWTVIKWIKEKAAWECKCVCGTIRKVQTRSLLTGRSTNCGCQRKIKAEQNLQTRFWSKVDKKSKDECWPWLAGIDEYGYGAFAINGRITRKAHRLSFEYTFGSIDNKLTIDHLCKNKKCVNPYHLEQVTFSENSKRANPPPTHCKKGHEFTPENTYIRTDGRRRSCKICMRQWDKER